MSSETLHYVKMLPSSFDTATWCLSEFSDIVSELRFVRKGRSDVMVRLTALEGIQEGTENAGYRIALNGSRP